MKKTLSNLLAAALLLLSAQLNAQSSTPTENAHNQNAGDKSITVGLLAWFGGYLPVYYEQQHDDRMSFQYGAGITFHSLKNDIGNNLQTILGESYLTDYSHRYAIPGLYLSFAPKFYKEGKCMNGFFYSPRIAFANYNYFAANDNTSGQVYEYRNCIDAKFYIGHHIKSADKIAFEWNVGLGIWTAFTRRLSSSYDAAASNATYISPSLSVNIALGGWY